MNNLNFEFLEKQRFFYRWKHILCSVLGWLALVAAVYFLFAAFQQNEDIRVGLYLFYGVASAFIAGGFALLVWLIKKKYAAFYRKHINGKILASAFPDLYYNEEAHLPFEGLRQSGLVLDFTDDKSEGFGLLSGMWNGVNFQMSSFHLQHQVNRHNSSNTSIVFSGIVVTVERNNPVNGTVAITQDIAERFFGGAIGDFFQNLNAKARRQQLIKINHAEFEKKFAVYADDYTEATKLLDNRFCEWLLLQQQKQEKDAAFKMAGIEISIQPDRVYIVWKAKDPSKADELTATVQTPITAANVEKIRANISQRMDIVKELFDLLG